MDEIKLNFYDSETANRFVTLSNEPFLQCAVETTASIRLEIQGKAVNLEEKNARRLAEKILELLQ